MDLSRASVLVTGADGFIGSHLIEALNGKCGRLTAFCQYNSFNSYGNLDNLIPGAKGELGDPRSAYCVLRSAYCDANPAYCDARSVFNDVQFVSGDVRDPFFCAKACKGVDVVFNLAALIAIPYSYTAPQSYIDTNVSGALNICQAALACGASRVIQMSTSEVYGTAEYVPIDERHPLKPQSPYSASKIGADSVALSFWHSFELPVVIARPFNTYGPRQSARAFIPTIITQIISLIAPQIESLISQQITPLVASQIAPQLASRSGRVKLGCTTSTRDMNFVKDTCDALIKIAECDDAIGEVVNIGSGAEVSVKDVFELICDIMGAEGVEIEQDEQRMRPPGSEVLRLVCDNSKLRKLTGFSPSYSLEAGLRETIAWFMSDGNIDKYKSDIYNM